MGVSSVRRAGAVATAATMVLGIAAVTTTSAGGAVTPAPKPPRCTEIVQVWAGGDPAVAGGLAQAADFIPGAPEVATLRVRARAQKELSERRFERVKVRGLSDPYFTGYRGTAAKVAGALRSQARRCPDSMLVASGHSEGAVAVRQAVRELTRPGDARVRGRLGALLLYGDPLTRRGETSVAPVSLDERDDVRGVLTGEGPRLALPRWVTRARLATSVCVSHDPVCSRGVNATDIGSHYSYADYLYADFRTDGGGADIAVALDYLPTTRVVRVPMVVGQRVVVRVGDEWSQRVKVSAAARLPRGLALRRGVISGRVPEGRYVVRLRVRGKQAAPAVKRSVKLVVHVRRQAASAGTTLVSRGLGGEPANAPSRDVHVSGDGGTVVFASRATNLVDTDVSAGLREPGSAVAYVWDAATGAVALLGVAPDRTVLDAVPIDISTDGRFVLLRTAAGDLHLRDRQQAASTLVPDPQPAPDAPELQVGRAGGASLAADGSFVDVGITRPGIWRWNRLDGSTRTFPLDTAFAASSPDGQVAAAGGDSNRDIYLRNLATGVSGPVVPGSSSLHHPWSELSAAGRTMASHATTIGGDYVDDKRVLDLERSVFLDRGLAFIPGVSADGEWYTGDARSWELQVRRTDDALTYDAFVRRPFDGDARTARPEAASLSGDGGVGAYTSAAVDLLPGVRPDVAQVYFWPVPR